MQWREDWSSASVVNHTIVTDPTIRQPGFDLPRHTWSLWWTVSGQVKAHVLTVTNGVSPNHLPVIVASDRPRTTLSTRARWQNSKAGWIYSTKRMMSRSYGCNLRRLQHSRNKSFEDTVPVSELEIKLLIRDPTRYCRWTFWKAKLCLSCVLHHEWNDTSQGTVGLCIIDIWAELSMGPFRVTQPNPTHYKWKNLDPTKPNPIQLTMELAVW